MVSLLLCIGQTITAQTNIWGKNMGVIIGGMSIQSVAENNSFVINGFPSNTNPEQFIINFDNEGNQLWQTTGMRSSRSMSNWGNNIMATDSGQTIVLLDYAGNIVKTVSLSEVIASNYYIYYICRDKNTGNYYMVSTSADWSSTKWMVFIYDSNLNFVRSFSIMDSQFGDIISAFAQNSGTYLARWRYGSGVVTNKVSDIYKYDSLGNLIWTKTLLDYDDPYIIQGDDGIYFASRKYYMVNSASGSEKWEVAKLNSETGDPIWSKEWLGSVSGNFEVTCVNGILNLPGGGCLVLGQTNKTGQHDVYNPLVIGYSSQGDSLFAIEPTESSSAGEFDLGTWDNNHALILSGSIDGVSKLWKYSIPGITSVKQETPGIPKNFSLSQNYPNPFNPSTTINFSVPQSGQVTLKVYNLLGCEVATLVNENLRVGSYNAKFDASQLASGIYVYRLTAKNFTRSKKMMLMK